MDRVINIEGVGTRSPGLLNSRNMAVTSRGHWTTKLTSGQHHLLERVRGPFLCHFNRQLVKVVIFHTSCYKSSLRPWLDASLFFLKPRLTSYISEIFLSNFPPFSTRQGSRPLFPLAGVRSFIASSSPSLRASPFNFRVCFPGSRCVPASKWIDLSALPVFGSCLFAPRAGGSSALRLGPCSLAPR